ncbi:MAG: DUF4013 domain-containing protein [Leptolinea sp.]|jgi:hypothetical protein|nr:DUF4013 domain-containing protein [Leptolinea sp.]
MDFGLPFSFPFQDQAWFKKLAIAGLITLIPVVGWLYILGWSLEIARQLIKKEPVVIPETDFGKFTVRGLKAWVISLVYAIPSMIFQVPNILTNVVAQTTTNDDGSGTVLGGLAIITICTSILNVVYSLILVYVMPAVYAVFLNNNEEIGAGFKFDEIFTLIKKAPMAYLLVWIGTLIAGVISGAGVIVCFVGLLITVPYSVLIMGHFYGQAFLETTKVP